MKDLDDFQREVGEWGEATFPESNAVSIARHLNEEVRELQIALDSAVVTAFSGLRIDESSIREEVADCMLLLTHLAHQIGFSLFDAAREKHAVNTLRTWEADDGGKGYWKHVDAPLGS